MRGRHRRFDAGIGLDCTPKGLCSRQFPATLRTQSLPPGRWWCHAIPQASQHADAVSARPPSKRPAWIGPHEGAGAFPAAPLADPTATQPILWASGRSPAAILQYLKNPIYRILPIRMAGIRGNGLRADESRGLIHDTLTCSGVHQCGVRIRRRRRECAGRRCDR